MVKNDFKTEAEVDAWVDSKPSRGAILALREMVLNNIHEGNGIDTSNIRIYRAMMKAAHQSHGEERMSLAKMEETWFEHMMNGDKEMSNSLRSFGEKNIISAFLEQIDGGDYPSPEVVHTLGSIFEYYLVMDGKVSLDEAFFGAKHNKRTSFATKRMAEVYEWFSLSITFDISDSFISAQTLEQKAEIFMREDKYYMSKLKNMDLEAFLAGYRKFRDGSPIPQSHKLKDD